MPIRLEDIRRYISLASWGEYLDNKEDTAFVEQIRQTTQSGRVLTDNDRVLKCVEELAKRDLQVLKRGRPRKTQN